MTIDTDDDVAALQRIGRIVSRVLREMLDAAEPGMTTRELDGSVSNGSHDTAHARRPGSPTTSRAPPASASTRRPHTAFLGIECCDRATC